MKEIAPDQVAVYVRWSTEDQGEGTTLDVQLEACQSYLRSQGWHFRPDLLFVDDGYSGATLDRPALGRLRAQVAEGQVDCVVCYKLDRLSRSVVDTVNLVLQEWEDRCHVKSAREPIDTASQAGRLFFYTLVSYAEWERAVIRERTAAGRLRRAQEGRWAAGRPPYGYQVSPERRLVPDADEAAVVVRIFQAYLAGRGTQAIAAQLNADGIAFRGRPWRAGAVKRALENPVYTGLLTFGATRVNPRYQKRAGEPRNQRTAAPAVRLAGGAPALISQADWEATVARRRARHPATATAGPRAFTSPYLLSALAKCARCGDPLVGLKRPEGREPVYICRGRRERGPAYCDAGLIGQAALHDQVIGTLRHLVSGPVHLQRWRLALTSALDSHRQEAEAGSKRLRRTLARLKNEQQHISQLLRSGAISATEYRQLAGEIDQDRTAAEERLAEVGYLLRAHLAAAVQLDDPGAWAGLTNAEQKRLLEYFIATLRAYKPKGAHEMAIEIVWKLSDTHAETATPPTFRANVENNGSCEIAL